MMKFQGSNCPATVVAGWLEVGALLPFAREVVVRVWIVVHLDHHAGAGEDANKTDARTHLSETVWNVSTKS